MLLGYNTNGFAHHRLEDAIVLLADWVIAALPSRSITTRSTRSTPACRVSCPGAGLLEEHGLRSVVETGARFLLDPAASTSRRCSAPPPNANGGSTS